MSSAVSKTQFIGAGAYNLKAPCDEIEVCRAGSSHVIIR